MTLGQTAYQPSQDELARYVETGEATQQFRNWMATHWLEIVSAHPSPPFVKRDAIKA